MNFKAILCGLVAPLFPALAMAQSSPSLQTGQVPSAAQWNSYFTSKIDLSALGNTVAPLVAGQVPVANLPVGTTSATVAAGTVSATANAAAVAAAAAQVTANAAFPNAAAGPLATQAGANSAAAIVGAIGAVHNVTASGSYTVLGTDLYVCINKTTPAPTAVLLPSTFNQSNLLNIKDCAGNSGTFPITITPASGTIDGQSSASISINYEALTLSYNGNGWSVW